MPKFVRGRPDPQPKGGTLWIYKPIGDDDPQAAAAAFDNEIPEDLEYVEVYDSKEAHEKPEPPVAEGEPGSVE